MSKIRNLVLIFLTCTISLAAQEPAKTQQSAITSDSNKFLIRWGDATLGYSLSGEEEILHQDEMGIIIGSNGHPTRLIANYTFSPTVLNSGLQLEFISLKSVVMAGFTSESDREKFHRIPEWLPSLCDIEALVLSNAELGSFTTCENLPLKYLDLRKVHVIDRASVLKTIGKFRDLEIFFHDDSFLPEDLTTIKEKLPNVKFASKPKDEIPQSNPDEMKLITTMDLIFLAKLAQETLSFDQFFEHYFSNLKPDQQNKLLNQIVFLTKKLKLNQEDLNSIVSEFASNADSTLEKILTEVLVSEDIEIILEYQKTDVKKTATLLLDLFAASYMKVYNREPHNGEKFWYWDFETADFDITTMNLKKTFNIDDF